MSMFFTQYSLDLALAAIGKNVYFQAILLFVGTIFFFYLGISGLKTVFKKNITKVDIIKKQKDLHPVIIGIMMTLPNPFVIVFWATAYTSLQTNFSIIVPIVIFAVGITWSTIEAVIVHSFRKFIKEKYLKIIELFIALILIIFGCKFFVQVIQIILK